MVNLSAILVARKKAREAYDLAVASETRVGDAKVREELRYNKAVAAFQLGRYGEALQGLSTYAEGHPEDASCHFLAGVSAFRLGRDATARRAFATYLALRPQALDREMVEGVLAEIESRTPAKRP